MKVLISGSFWHGSLEESYARAFESIGWSVVRFDWDQIARAHPLAVNPLTMNKLGDKLLRFRIADRVGKWLITAVEDSHPDLALIVKGRTISPDTLSGVKSKLGGAPLVNFNPDSPWEPQNTSKRLQASIPVYHAHFTWNRRLIGQFLGAGAKVAHYLPFAYDPVLHSPIESVRDTPHFDAAFVGTYAPDRDKLLTTLRGCKIGIWGNGWERSALVPREWIQSKAIYGEDATKILDKSVCALNLLRPQNEGSHNMRTFEIPATRNVMLTTRSEEQSQFFTEGEEMECFATPEELLEKINLLKSDPDRARSIAVRCYERVRNETYAKRARTMLDILGLGAPPR